MGLRVPLVLQNKALALTELAFACIRKGRMQPRATHARRTRSDALAFLMDQRAWCARANAVIRRFWGAILPRQRLRQPKPSALLQVITTQSYQRAPPEMYAALIACTESAPSAPLAHPFRGALASPPSNVGPEQQHSHRADPQAQSLTKMRRTPRFGSPTYFCVCRSAMSVRLARAAQGRWRCRNRLALLARAACKATGSRPRPKPADDDSLLMKWSSPLGDFSRTD